ncbi:MAG TPA: hypothetical protein VGM41_10555 [Chitinophagaceae bacterium]|jgi:hypothetical protein
MSKRGKIYLGIVSFFPIAFFIIYTIYFLSMFTSAFRESVRQSGPPAFLLGNMGQMQISMTLSIVTALGLLIYYIIHVMNNRRLDSTERLTWVLIILLANVVSYPVYWYLKIWKRPENGAQRQ